MYVCKQNFCMCLLYLVLCPVIIVGVVSFGYTEILQFFVGILFLLVYDYYEHNIEVHI